MESIRAETGGKVLDIVRVEQDGMNWKIKDHA